MVELQLLQSPTDERFAAFTYPAFRSRLAQGSSDLLPVGAFVDGEPAGLALAEVRSDHTAVVLSVFVAPAHRGRGIGAALLRQLEDALRLREVRHVSGDYPAGKPTTAALEKILQRSCWSPPEPLFLVVQSRAERIRELPWVRESPNLPAGFTVFPWGDLRPADRDDILTRNLDTEWYPDHLGPFFEEESLDLATSLGIALHGQVVGWQINHRIRPDLHRFSRTWLRSDLQRLGRSIALMAESVRRYLAAGIPQAIMTISAQNVSMVRFFERRIAPYATSVQQVNYVERMLEPERFAK